jgi:hypothetical protein
MSVIVLVIVQNTQMGIKTSQGAVHRTQAPTQLSHTAMSQRRVPDQTMREVARAEKEGEGHANNC